MNIKVKISMKEKKLGGRPKLASYQKRTKCFRVMFTENDYIYIQSKAHKRRFEIKNDIFKIEKSSVDENKLVLTINRQPIGEWFKEQWEKLRHGLRQSAEEPRKSRGFRM